MRLSLLLSISLYLKIHLLLFMLLGVAMSQQEDWNVYLCRVEDKPASIVLDLALINRPLDQVKTELTWLEVLINEPTEGGFANLTEEENYLYNLEDELVKEIKSQLDGIYVGRLTSAGTRTFYFYTSKDTAYKNIFQEIMANYPQHNFRYGNQADEEWKIYREFLYPDEFSLQSISNRVLIEKLQEHGDTLEKSRRVDHWIYFKNIDDRTEYIQKVKEKSFTVEKIENEESSNSYQYMLQIWREDKVDYNSMDDVAYYLLELALKYDADYDGWETSVIKPNKP